jgi:hypothetical protein
LTEIRYKGDEVLKAIDSELMSSPVEGLNLVTGTLGDQLSNSGDLLFFLRHLG